MPRGKSLFKTTDMLRAIRTVRTAGLPVQDVIVQKDGSFKVSIGEPDGVEHTDVVDGKEGG